MATIRKQLKKITELYVPRAGDEREFVAKHRVEIIDKQGKDSISKETPYELILKNVAAVKAPPHGSDDHGHEAPGESEAAYHIPESREAIIAKLSEMMGNEKDEDEEEDDEDDEDDDDEDEREIKEAKKQRTDVPTGLRVTYRGPKGEEHEETYFSAKTAAKFEKEHRKAGRKVVKRELQYGKAGIKEGLLDKAKTVAKNFSGIVNPKTPEEKAKSIQRSAQASFYTSRLKRDDANRKAAGMEPLGGVDRLKVKAAGLKRAAEPYIKAALKGVREQADIEETEQVDEMKSSNPRGLAYRITAASHAANPSYGPHDPTVDPKTNFGAAATRSSAAAGLRAARKIHRSGGNVHSPENIDTISKAIHGSPDDHEGKPRGWSHTAMTNPNQTPEQKARRAKLTGPYGGLSDDEKEKDRQIARVIAQRVKRTVDESFNDMAHATKHYNTHAGIIRRNVDAAYAGNTEAIKATKNSTKEMNRAARWMNHPSRGGAGYAPLTNEEVEQIDEMQPLLPKQKKVFDKILKKEMEKIKQERMSGRQAGTRYYHQSIKKHKIDNA